MATYRFKELHAVPEANEMIDIAFSTTQRKTPNQCHKQWKISRIRKFYTRKVKFCGQMAHDLLSRILDDFPRIDDVHPFYAQLLNVIYNKDHYKIALGLVNKIRGSCDRSVSDYVRLMKYADSQFKCKSLKTACFGKIGTYIKKLKEALKYLEECRKHMSRLPQINPSGRSIIVAGYPNVGKSSFMNQVSMANVEVEPYAFTTKSIYVGHFDYNCLRWQVIDTPGLLDRENMRDYTSAENQAITALGYIRASILFILDISEECGFRLQKQVELFHKIKDLFKDKPVLVVLNKSDVRPSSDLSDDEKKLIDSMAGDEVEFIDGMSTLTGVGVSNARDKACNLLIDSLVSRKASSKRIEGIDNQLTVVQPKSMNPRRVTTIPESVLAALSGDDIAETDEFETLKEECERGGGVGVFQLDTRKEWQLEDEDWNYDVVPEIFDGKNIGDFVDPDIMEKLAILEAEEAQLLAAYGVEDKDDGNWDENSKMMKTIADGIELKRAVHDLKLGTTGKATTRRHKIVKDSKVETGLNKHGFQTDGILSTSINRKLGRHIIIHDDVEYTKNVRRPEVKDVTLLDNVDSRRSNKEFIKARGNLQRAGPGDKEIHTMRPKHLFSGKRRFNLDRR
eukprot:GHVH01011584.1.p1 GENE.GHVH01011584.1~~GHVH01011584.1.p1  ORF type:complete len:635 (+),score=96.78 GHVH01011584.1:41-1906(+)